MMKVPNDVKCGVCKRIFCCAECRYKHELKSHAIVVQKPSTELDALQQPTHNDHCIGSSKNKIYLFCPLCEQQPLPLQRVMYMEMLEHVANFHLPLRCRKCNKIYVDIADLREFSKCLSPLVHECCQQQDYCCTERVKGENCEAITVRKELDKVTISTQTSPPPQQGGAINNTPLSVVNVRWKAKEFVSDSVSSLKNISSINGSMRRSLEAPAKPKAPLVRTTSTPVHAELLCIKQTERTFNASGGQVSSIYSNGVETDHSPAAAAAATNVVVNSPAKQQLESVQRYLKVGGGRGKLSAVTPLRQVMSKSIQKAFAEHGALPAMGMTGGEWPLRKKIFDSNSVDSSNGSCVGSPLDLRLSPAVRRTQSEVCASATATAATTSNANKDGSSPTDKRVTTPSMRCEILLSSQKLTTESIVITRTKHLASMESTASSMGDGFNSISSKYGEQSTSSGSSSGVSSASGSSIYKTCHSVEIITATTALSEVNIQEDFHTAKEGNCKLEAENEIETMSVVTQTVNNNLPPITPITRIPGAVINKKFIRFDSPQEETEIELENATEHESEHEPKPKPKPQPDTKVQNMDTFEKQSQPELKNINDADCSDAEVFFTPTATPIRKQKKRVPIEALIAAFEKGAALNHKQQTKKTATINRPLRVDCAKAPTSNDIADTPEKYSDEVFLPKGATPKKVKSKSSLATVGRSWSFSALLGTVMRLPSSMGKCSNKKNVDGDVNADVEDTAAANTGSLIKRCASIAGSLVRPKPSVDEEQLGNLKRKRSYTADLRSSSVHQRSSSETISPNTDHSISTKRFRIQGRKPIERMRQNT